MIFAMAALHQAVGSDGVIAERCGRVEPNAFVRDLVDFAGGLPKVRFERRPIGVMQAAQDDAQAVVSKFDRTKALPDKGFQGVDMVLRPILNADLAVIRLGQQERQPHGSQPTIGQALV